ncbi:hypothetical protein RJT34_30434 [Clitoria ternatea]|uniref:Uncharacterized protein n=1 Tax=Clitoria ternatea TaxID=43366 RepID=A0AAN9I0D9_CLITE
MECFITYNNVNCAPSIFINFEWKLMLSYSVFDPLYFGINRAFGRSVRNTLRRLEFDLVGENTTHGISRPHML